jgi:SAM-dependent methyltransferase
MENVYCNYCGSDAFDLLGTFRDVEFDNPGEFPYVRCRECGLIYLHIRPTPAELHLYYPAEYQPFRTAIQDERYPWMRWARQRNIHKYCQVVEQGSSLSDGRILDVGCSTGIFLDAMRSKGWETIGVEISAEAVQYAQHRFGLDVFPGQLSDNQFDPESFDAITLWNVFEHLFEPFETLKETYRLLKNEGVLIMVFPSWESLDRQIFGESWIGFDAPRHLFVYPRSVYRNMIQTAGLEIVQLQPGPNNYFAFTASLDRWLKSNVKNTALRNAMGKLMNAPGMRYVFQPFIWLADSLGKGATTLVIARKRKAVSDN